MNTQVLPLRHDEVFEMPNADLKEVNFPTGLTSVVTVANFQTKDRPDNDTLYQLKIPLTNTKYSYWKVFCIELISLPSSYIDNIKVYSDGNNNLGTGVTLKISNDTTLYQQASGTEGEEGDEMLANYSGLTTSTDLFSYTVGSSRDVNISESGNRLDSVGEKSDYFVMQIGVDNTASIGVTAAEILTVQYDEY